MYGGYQVVLSEEKDKGDYITRRFKISQVDGVRHLCLTNLIANIT